MPQQQSVSGLRVLPPVRNPLFKDGFFTFDTEVSMTRETKIGLLMGLGFIVAFAVLLLQTGDRPPSGDLQMMLSRHGNSVTGRPETLARLPEPISPSGTATSPAVSTGEHIAESLTRATEPWNRGLPNPAIFNAKPDYRELGPGGSEITEALIPQPRIGPDTPSIAPVRVAPTNDVKPLSRPDVPKPSPEPDMSITTPEVERSQTTPSLPVDPSPVINELTAPATYVVQKGDSLMRIARKHYNSQSAEVLDFLLKSNRDRIRDRHVVQAGQTLLIPVLPVNLRNDSMGNDAAGARSMVPPENPGSSADSHGNAGIRVLHAERVVPPLHKLVDADERKASAEVLAKVRAPLDAADRSKDARTGSNRDSLPSATGNRDKSEQGSQPKASAGEKRSASSEKSDDHGYRWYTIRPKDTLGLIADKELGGSANWEEIVKLNKNLNPAKLKVGDRIRLPERKPTSDSSKRSST
ncbi:MAG: LysM peptidoglycan-binding domain-containing protein [Phycisphaerae bacterium]